MTYEIVDENDISLRKTNVFCNNNININNERDLLLFSGGGATSASVSETLNWIFPSSTNQTCQPEREENYLENAYFLETATSDDYQQPSASLKVLQSSSSLSSSTISRDHQEAIQSISENRKNRRQKITFKMDTNHHSNQNHSSTRPPSGFHIGLYGWRKKCLYVLILGLMLLIIVNLALTLWILKVMEFSSEGMGQLKVVAGGLQLSGQALVLDMLRASTIRSRHAQPISIESSRNFSINTRDTEGFIENQIFLGHDKFECLANGFRITDTHGGNLFSVDREEVTIGANALRIDGEGGAIFRESIQTPLVRAEAGRELRLESPTRSLQMMASQEIYIQSRAGSLDATCLNDMKLHSVAGSIRLDSPNIVLPNLKTAQPPPSGVSPGRDHLHKVYQLCACFSGKLFLASPHSICAGDDSTVCR